MQAAFHFGTVRLEVSKNRSDQNLKSLKSKFTSLFELKFQIFSVKTKTLHLDELGQRTPRLDLKQTTCSERVYYLSSWTKSLGFSTCVTRKIKQRTDLNSRSDIPRYYPPFHLLNSYQNEGNIWHGHGKNIWMGYCFIGSSLLSKTKYILVMLIVIQINSVYFVA